MFYWSDNWSNNDPIMIAIPDINALNNMPNTISTPFRFS